MRVILTQDVPKLGNVGDVCTVKPGFGRNYLLPQGLAMLATTGGLRQVGDLKRSETRRQDRIRAQMMSFADRIAAHPVEFRVKVGQTGRLYGSVTASDIAEALESKVGEAIDRRKIVMDESLRTLGEHKVAIHLMQGVNGAITVNLVPDGELVADAPVEEPAAATADDAAVGDEDSVSDEPSDG
ncbi:MAG: 50S ribosomal protein L9 [Anaerolineae bacterium]|jgi:large subunit ribosomal protein L9|nr:50S ribosomal protein L9 [Ardenticatenia bacterium]MBK8539841.1 50S ribosomal protein L9 [Ardenticatenia bacterium]HQZ70283.1 50S ribosomal protein L9 [Anaerolineae bacterium]HRA19455.1 50S ribosomal protein L9 [Anaerolineae bacterium]